MKPRTRLSSPALAGLVCALGLLVPGAQARAEERVVRVCLYEFMPLVGGASEAPKGLYVDLLRQVAASEGWTLEYQQGTWDECLGRVSRGEVDLQPCIGWTKERARVLDFNRIPPHLDWGVVYAREHEHLRTIFDLTGKRVGVLQGSIYTTGFRSLLEQFGIAAELVVKPTYREVFEAVRRGELDAGINGQLAGSLLAGEHDLAPTLIYFSPVKLHFAAPKGRASALLAALDTRLEALRGEPGSGWYEAQARWVDPSRRRAGLPGWVGPSLALGALLLLGAFAFAWALRRQVERRTRDLMAANRSLAESEARRSTALAGLKQAQRIAGMGSWTWDLKSQRVEWSDQMFEIFGVDRATFGGDVAAVVARAVHPDDQAAVERANRSVLEEGVPVPLHYRVVRPDGEVRQVWAEAGETTRDAAGAPAVLSGIVQDVTDRSRLEEALRQASKLEAIGRLSGGVAHDFNNILAVQSSLIGSLVDDDLTPEERREAVEELKDSVKRAATLTRQLLLFGRRQAMTRARHDLNDVVGEVTRMLRRVIGEDIDLQVRPAGQPLWVEGDAGMLQQVALNLCVNARDAMPRGGRLEVSTGEAQLVAGPGGAAVPVHPAGQYVCLRVADTGVGIEPAHRELIFDPFFTTKPVGKGTGLGLATVHGIAAQHGGWVEVDSVVGKGSTFTVYVPRSGPSERDTPPPPPALPAAPALARVLLVEDEPALRRAVASGLRRLGFEVVEAADGVEAQAAWDRVEGRIDLLCTDMVMPNGVSGLELGRRLRARRHDLKVVVASGYSNDLLQGELASAGWATFIAKPYDVPALITAIRQAMGGPRPS